ncbi:MAG: phosphoribosylformylglycinamidine synthase [Oscillospiraceae bacterium]|jgi:phosphoribosylformylglycinamidine synthase|nr:phosphoribosylformylglycinamidine synthase [Oscillospiraceae bacterium]
MSVYRVYTERRDGFDIEAKKVLSDIYEAYGIKLSSLKIFNRYDVENITGDVFIKACSTVMSEPQTDLWHLETLPEQGGNVTVIAVEALPGQYDQRADSCAQCIQMMTRGERPRVQTAKLYIFGEALDKLTEMRVKNHLINPVESREAGLAKPDTLEGKFNVPTEVAVLDGFTGLDAAGLAKVWNENGLAMDMDDIEFLQGYFKKEGRDPTITELKMVDTYWSDHCRHTTFSTNITHIAIEDEDILEAYGEYLGAREEVYGGGADNRPCTLMDIATIGVKLLKKRGLLPLLDESEEINACSVKVEAMVDGKPEDWILMFKNETHNHPTEIEPFGGAATCLGGAIRDPLSGRSYVYQAMRVTGAGDPTLPVSETPAGKLPQRKLTRTAAEGYSSYGNQIGLATGIVDELYHPGYVAKRLEIGAVVGAAPAKNIVRKRPEDGDVIILLGGRTGRDGLGGATGSSKTHTLDSLTDCASEVQKGNPPEERKIQRLFRNPEVSGMIKRCNDFGAGGVSVAIGELADGLVIELDKVPKKYEGLDGTEIAISESQERMAVVVDPADAERFIEMANGENLEATVVASVTEEPRLKMNWNGKKIVDISREFLDSNGAVKHSSVKINKLAKPVIKKNAEDSLIDIISQLSAASRRGLVEMFDGTIGAASVLMPFGGKAQLTPAQSMAALFPVDGGETTTCSVMAYGFDPYISEQNPFEGAKMAVVSSVSKLVASGCDYKKSYLTLQEYFERLRNDPVRWGKPFSALLGAFKAQKELGIAAIGGKDSMSGSFMELDVPPTLVSFAICAEDASNIVSPEFKRAGSSVYLFRSEDGGFEGLKEIWEKVHGLIRGGKIVSAWALGTGTGVEGIMKMSFGNGVGFKASRNVDENVFYTDYCGGVLVETSEKIDGALFIGRTTAEKVIEIFDRRETIESLIRAWEKPLEKIFPTRAAAEGNIQRVSCYAKSQIKRQTSVAKPLAVIPVFPGTNCEYDTKRAVERAGGEAEIVIIRNRAPSDLERSADELEKAIRRAQMIILPGGFSGGDEPDGSAKFITSFFRNERITEATHELLYKNDGLMLGICNGFQALVKLGLLPFGEIRTVDENSPTLTYNVIGRHQSKYVLTRVSSTKSPWLSMCEVDDLHAIPVSHGEGRFVANKEIIDSLIDNGQIAFQYVGEDLMPSMDISVNPNGSAMAIEGIISPDGRILGKMGHTERRGEHVAKNIYFEKHQPLFEGGVRYFMV